MKLARISVGVTNALREHVGNLAYKNNPALVYQLVMAINLPE